MTVRAAAYSERGVALGVVLWFLAGMSLLVSGIVYQARQDTHMAQLHVSRATAVAAGDGAIMLMLAELVSRDQDKGAGRSNLSRRFTVGRHPVSVELVSTRGLLNVVKAPANMMAALLVSKGRMPRDKALKLALDVVKWREMRDRRNPRKQANQLLAPEDLLQVPGFNRSLWEAIRDFIVVDASGSRSGLDKSRASTALRAALGGTDFPEADSIAQAADAEDQRLDPAGMFRVDARVTYGDSTWLRRRWVQLGGRANRGLPWRVNRVEAPRVVSAADRP